MKKTEIAWAAGLFDGEGTVGAYRRWGEKSAFAVMLRIGMTTRRDVARFARIFSLRIYKNGRMYFVALRSQRTGQVLRILRPFSTGKRAQMELALRILSRQQQHGSGGRGYTKKEYQWMERAADKLREMKRV